MASGDQTMGQPGPVELGLDVVKEGETGGTQMEIKPERISPQGFGDPGKQVESDHERELKDIHGQMQTQGALVEKLSALVLEQRHSISMLMKEIKNSDTLDAPAKIISSQPVENKIKTYAEAAQTEHKNVNTERITYVDTPIGAYEYNVSQQKFALSKGRMSPVDSVGNMAAPPTPCLSRPYDNGFPAYEERTPYEPIKTQTYESAGAYIYENKGQTNAPVTVVCNIPDQWGSGGAYGPSSPLRPFEYLPDDTLGVERFIAEFRELLIEHRWSDRKGRSILERHLVGRAYTAYFAGLGRNNLMTLEERLQEMVEVFSLKPSIEEIKKLFRECAQQKGESVRFFKVRLTALAESLRPSILYDPEGFDRMLLGQFKRGLRYELSMEVIRRGPATFKQAVEHATEMEKEIKLLNQHGISEGSPAKLEQSELAKQVECLRKEMAAKGAEARPVFTPRNPAVCNYCKRIGHSERVCWYKNMPPGPSNDGGTTQSRPVVDSGTPAPLNHGAPRS